MHDEPRNPFTSLTDVQQHINGWQHGQKKKTTDKKTIQTLFDRFSIIWGNKWDKAFENNPELIAKEWSESLAGLSRQAIQQGLSKTRQTLTWPPTIAEFLQACKGAEISEEVKANYFNCNIGGCPNVGTMCRATHGNNWVCNHHYQQGKG